LVVDSIRQAIDMARGTSLSSTRDAATEDTSAEFVSVRLNPALLETHRIVAHGGLDAQSRYYDMLRTQVLQEMDRSGWQFLAVTSATSGCGKSVTACNLAISISRLPKHSVLLVDLDFHKPSVAEYLGIDAPSGVLSVLEGRANLSDVVIEAQFGRNSVLVLPGEECESGAAEWMTSESMATLLQTIKRNFRSRIVIFDLPPMLVSDDVISILPQMDAALLVAGVGETAPADIQECQKHLSSTPVVRVVVNRVTDQAGAYYGYGYGYGRKK
jgi:Mrp family chromosome partitioning ATPase